MSKKRLSENPLFYGKIHHFRQTTQEFLYRLKIKNYTYLAYIGISDVVCLRSKIICNQMSEAIYSALFFFLLIRITTITTANIITKAVSIPVAVVTPLDS